MELSCVLLADVNRGFMFCSSAPVVRVKSLKLTDDVFSLCPSNSAFSVAPVSLGICSLGTGIWVSGEQSPLFKQRRPPSVLAVWSHLCFLHVQFAKAVFRWEFLKGQDGPKDRALTADVARRAGQNILVTRLRRARIRRMARRPEDLAERRRQQIVDAAICCVARDGYAATSLRKIARAAGLNQGLLHYYFKSASDHQTAREGILDAALRATIERVEGVIRKAKTGEDVRAQLSAFITGLLSLDVNSRVVLLESLGGAIFDEGVRQATDDLHRKIKRAIRAIARKGSGSRVLRRRALDEIAILVLGIVEGVVRQQTLSHGIIRQEAVVRICAEVLGAYLEELGPQKTGQERGAAERRSRSRLTAGDINAELRRRQAVTPIPEENEEI